jgi:hypothetical protein
MADKEEGRVHAEEKVVVIKQEVLETRYVREEDFEAPEWEVVSVSDESDDEIEVSEITVKETADFMRRIKRETTWREEDGSPFVAALKGDIGPVPDPVTAGLREQVEREVGRWCPTVKHLISPILKRI